MSTQVTQGDVKELLDDHSEVERCTWQDHSQELYVEFEVGKLAGRSFIDDMASEGLSVIFVDFATNTIGFSRD